MAYLGNLSCRDCGLTFTARWGSSRGADEYRCENDHCFDVDAVTGAFLGGSAATSGRYTLAEVFGRCPICSTELASGRLPCCPVCSGRDHDVSVGGVVG